MKEEWKDVVGYEGIYKVSNMGRVKSIPRKFRRVCDSVDSFAKGKNLKCGLATTGYPSVDLRKDGTKKTIYVHSLVAQAFIGDRPEGCDVMHLDGTRTNNYASNLRYGSRSCNLAFTVDDGTAKHGEKHHNSKLTRAKVKRIREFYSVGIRAVELAECFCVSRRTISDAVSGRTWADV